MAITRAIGRLHRTTCAILMLKRGRLCDRHNSVWCYRLCSAWRFDRSAAVVLRLDRAELLRIRGHICPAFADRAITARKGSDAKENDSSPHFDSADGGGPRFQGGPAIKSRALFLCADILTLADLSA